MKSVIQTEKKCFFCGKTTGLQEHHVFFGAKNRSLSERYGLKAWLCLEHHTGQHSVHREKAMDLALKMHAQSKFEEMYSREEFRKLFGKNYL